MGTRSQTHCASGHEFTPENTYWKYRKARGRRQAGVQRQCRECTLYSNKLWRAYKSKEYGDAPKHGELT